MSVLIATLKGDAVLMSERVLKHLVIPVGVLSLVVVGCKQLVGDVAEILMILYIFGSIENLCTLAK